MSWAFADLAVFLVVVLPFTGVAAEPLGGLTNLVAVHAYPVLVAVGRAARRAVPRVLLHCVVARANLNPEHGMEWNRK